MRFHSLIEIDVQIIGLTNLILKATFLTYYFKQYL